MGRTTNQLNLDQLGFRSGSTSRKVAEALLTGGEWTRSELEETFGIKKTNVYRVMSQLRDAGVEILSEGSGSGGKLPDGSPNRTSYRVSGAPVNLRDTPKKSRNKPTKATPGPAEPKQKGGRTTQAQITNAEAILQEGAIKVSLAVAGMEYNGRTRWQEFETVSKMFGQVVAIANVEMTSEGFEVLLLGKGGNLKLRSVCCGE